jgi:hypothetical protein
MQDLSSRAILTRIVALLPAQGRLELKALLKALLALQEMGYVQTKQKSVYGLKIFD